MTATPLVGRALRRKLLSSSMLAVLAAGLGQGAWIGSALAEDKPIALSTITVTAPADAIDLPVGTKISGSELESQRVAVSNTVDLVNNMPGGAVWNGGGVSGLPVLGGLAGDRLRVNVAGMELIAACANQMNPPLSYISPSQVGSIHVFSNLVPVSVGGDSIGGAILVAPPVPTFAQAGQGLVTSGQAGAYFRSNGQGYGGYLSATVSGENVSLSYNGATSRSSNYSAGGWFKAPGFAYASIPGVVQNIPWLGSKVVGSTAYEAQNHDLALAIKRDNHLFQFDVGVQQIPYQLYPNQRMDMTQNNAIQANFRYTGLFDWGTLEAQLYHQTVRHEMDFGEDKQFYYGSPKTILAPGMPMNTKGQNTGAKVKATYNLADGQLVRAGLDLQHYEYNEWWPPSPAVLPAGYALGGMAPNTFVAINDGRRDRIDPFVEWEARWNPLWTTLLGVRSDTVLMDTGPVEGYNANYNAAPTYPATRFNLADRSKVYPNWDVTALAKYTPDDKQTYSFGFSRKTRAPNMYELYSWSTSMMAMEMVGWFGDGNYYVGNLALNPEAANTLSATADWHDPDGNWAFQITPYYTYITDYIDVQRCPLAVCGNTMMNRMNLTATTGFVSLQFVNQSARIFGVDMSGRVVLAKETPYGTFSVKGMLSYANGRNETTGDNLYNIMPLNAKIGLEQQWGGWTGLAELQLVAAKTEVSQVRNEVKTASYALVNLRGSYQWKNIRFDVGIENLFDTMYYLPTGGAYLGQGATMSGSAVAWGVPVPGPGRTLYVAANMKF